MRGLGNQSLKVSNNFELWLATGNFDRNIESKESFNDVKSYNFEKYFGYDLIISRKWHNHPNYYTDRNRDHENEVDFSFCLSVPSDGNIGLVTRSFRPDSPEYLNHQKIIIRNQESILCIKRFIPIEFNIISGIQDDVTLIEINFVSFEYDMLFLESSPDFEKNLMTIINKKENHI